MNEALAVYMKTFLKLPKCCRCGKTEEVFEDENACDYWCKPCVIEYYTLNPQELVDALHGGEGTIY